MAELPGHASGEQNVSKGDFIRIVPLPAGRQGFHLSRFGGTGHVPVNKQGPRPLCGRVFFQGNGFPVSFRAVIDICNSGPDTSSIS
jgi:hypothetical protein